MSTILEYSLKQALESLKRAEELLSNYCNGTLTLPAGVTFQDLKDYVTDCRERTREERQALVELSKYKMPIDEKQALESLKRAEEHLSNYWNGTLTLPAGVTFQDLQNEVTACRERAEEVEERQALVEVSKQRQALAEFELSKLQILNLLLQHSPTLAKFPLALPSSHPSEHNLTLTQKATKRQNRIVEKQQKKPQDAQLKSETILFYYAQPQTGAIKDMLTDNDFTVCDVNCSHIFLSSWEEATFKDLIIASGLEFQDITKDSPENMLLLNNNVQTKYDCAQLLIEYDASIQEFICRILDKRIANELIFLNPPVTFGQYDGKPLHFPSASRPLRRLIQFRAIVNRLVAIDRGYIQAEDYRYLMNSDDWFPGKKALFDSINEWIATIPEDAYLHVNTAPLQE